MSDNEAGVQEGWEENGSKFKKMERVSTLCTLERFLPYRPVPTLVAGNKPTGKGLKYIGINWHMTAHLTPSGKSGLTAEDEIILFRSHDGSVSSFN